MAKFYHDDVLPTRIKIVNKALLEYNAMQLSPYELFLAKSQELEAERNYIDTLRDYWITRAKLERTVGGKLTPRNPTSVAGGKTYDDGAGRHGRHGRDGNENPAQ